MVYRQFKVMASPPAVASVPPAAGVIVQRLRNYASNASLALVISPELLDHAAHRFALLGDPSRLRILSLLHERGEETPGAIAEATGLALANVSQHLSRMMAGGLVARRRGGHNAYYKITDSTLERLCDLVCSSVREHASALARA